jgi:hypothetical protein
MGGGTFADHDCHPQHLRAAPMQPAEKRDSRRRTVRYPASIDLGDGSPPRQCTLCDASEGGAQLLVDDPASLPNRFTLVLGYDGTARRNCRVMWRSETQIGVQFTKFPRLPRREASNNAGSGVEPESSSSFDIDTLRSG